MIFSKLFSRPAAVLIVGLSLLGSGFVAGQFLSNDSQSAEETVVSAGQEAPINWAADRDTPCRSGEAETIRDLVLPICLPPCISAQFIGTQNAKRLLERGLDFCSVATTTTEPEPESETCVCPEPEPESEPELEPAPAPTTTTTIPEPELVCTTPGNLVTTPMSVKMECLLDGKQIEKLESICMANPVTAGQYDCSLHYFATVLNDDDMTPLPADNPLDLTCAVTLQREPDILPVDSEFEAAQIVFAEFSFFHAPDEDLPDNPGFYVTGLVPFHLLPFITGSCSVNEYHQSVIYNFEIYNGPADHDTPFCKVVNDFGATDICALNQLDNRFLNRVDVPALLVLYPWWGNPPLS